MVVTATKEKIAKVSQELNPQERQTNNWFSCTPCSADFSRLNQSRERHAPRSGGAKNSENSTTARPVL